MVASAFVLSEGGPEARVYSPSSDPTRTLHETLGLAVFGVTALRLLWRAFDVRPLPAPMPTWMRLASLLLQGALYLLLVLVPLAGMFGAWLEGHAVTLAFGDIPAWFPASHPLGLLVSDVHTLLGNLIIWAAAAHAGAALFHHFVLKDGVLMSMLPGRSE